MKWKRLREQENFVAKIKDNEILPFGNVILNYIDEKKNCISTAEQWNQIDESYLVAYDKKNQNCIAAQIINARTAQSIVLDFSEQFLKEISSQKSVKYVRLCLALRKKNEYAYFYLKTELINEQNYIINKCYIKDFFDIKNKKNYLLYYSAGGLLSLKYLAKSKEIIKYLMPNIKDICIENDKLNFLFSYLDEKRTVFLHAESNEKNIELSYEKLDNDTYIASCDLDKILQLNISEFELCFLHNDKSFGIKSEKIDEKILESKDKHLYCKVSSNDIINIKFVQKKYEYLISVIIAVYNTKDFLQEAFDSILNQKVDKLTQFLGEETEKLEDAYIYDNLYQVILIDDGSEDGSGKICDEYAEKYKNFIVVHKKNEGV